MGLSSPLPPVVGRFREGGPAELDQPETAAPWARDAQLISLLRAPQSAAANHLTDTVAALTEPFLNRRRPLGAAGRTTHRDQIGTILGGLLRAGLQGHAVRARQGKSAGAWTASSVGQHAFWAKVDALEQAGLVEVLDGVRFLASGALNGVPAAIRITGALEALAAEAGVSRASIASDWPLTVAAQSERPVLPPGDVVTCYAIPECGSADRVRVDFPPQSAGDVAQRRAAVERLNAHLATASVTGCQPPVMRAVFFGDTRLHGRLYAVGQETFQQVPRRERDTIRIGGRAIVEVDTVGSQLAVLLAAAGRTIPADPYAEGELRNHPRQAVKAWVSQRLNTGGLPRRWSEQHPAEVRGASRQQIERAVLATYPELHHPVCLLPASLAATVPSGREGWAVGQWLTGLEASVLARALDVLIGADIIALPLHDAVLVAESNAEAAAAALMDAFRDVLGRPHRARIKPCRGL